MDEILRPKVMAVVVLISLLAGFFYLAHTSRQIAQATPVQTEIRSVHATRLTTAIDEAERSLSGAGESEDRDE